MNMIRPRRDDEGPTVMLSMVAQVITSTVRHSAIPGGYQMGGDTDGLAHSCYGVRPAKSATIRPCESRARTSAERCGSHLMHAHGLGDQRVTSVIHGKQET